MRLAWYFNGQIKEFLLLAMFFYLFFCLSGEFGYRIDVQDPHEPHPHNNKPISEINDRIMA